MTYYFNPVFCAFFLVGIVLIVAFGIYDEHKRAEQARRERYEYHKRRVNELLRH